MPKRLDFWVERATDVVMDAISNATGRVRADIDLDTVLEEFDLTTEELLRKIIAASRTSGFSKLAPKAFDHVKVVRDIVHVVVAARRPAKNIVIGETPSIIVLDNDDRLPPQKPQLQSQQQKPQYQRQQQTQPEPTPTAKPRATPGSSVAPAPPPPPLPAPRPDLLELRRESGGVTPGDRIDRRPLQIPADASATPEAPTAAPNSEAAPRAETERQVNVWVGQENQPSNRTLVIGKSYPLSFRVGAAVKASLLSGPEAGIDAGDIPPGGLPTQWRVISRDAELTGNSDIKVEVSTIEDGTQCWCGLFDLLIPEGGDSATLQLGITPRKADTRIDAIVTARGETYRQFRILLKATDKIATMALDPVTVEGKAAFTPATEIGLRAKREWTTPSGNLRINVIAGPRASAEGFVDGSDIRYPSEPWATPAQADGPLRNVHTAAEALRVAFEAHFNAIDPADLADRLQKWNKQPAGWGVPYNWSKLLFQADPSHEAEWKRMAESTPLRELAFHGKTLFDAFFPKTSRLRPIMLALPPGTRLDIAWTDGDSFIPHVPWGLMYAGDVPPVGAVDPMGFLGMRCRIAYTCYAVFSSSRALGAFKDTHRTHFLYWGSNETDATGQEARWQRDLWKDWGNQIFVPKASGAPQQPAESAQSAKTSLLQLLNKPEPAPTSLLYMFCQSDTETGNIPILRFGDTNDPVNILRQTDFGTTALADRPLIFANACGTASADTYQANMLEKLFFERDCRAYLGTEIKVPIALASRFATIFFHFFYRKLDPAPMAAGEAVVQTRLFLWTHYRNLGGLFYCYINQYDLCVADKEELEQLRA